MSIFESKKYDSDLGAYKLGSSSTSVVVVADGDDGAEYGMNSENGCSRDGRSVAYSYEDIVET